MKRLFFLIISVSLFFSILSAEGLNAAVMEDYCQVPPYVIQNVAPNVMIVLDNSGSMFNFAYVDPGADNLIDTADDNMCRDSGTPCTGFTFRGTYPTYKYYGYFNPDYWYTYSSNRFVPSAPKIGSGLSGARATSYKEIPLLLGKNKIVPLSFAENELLLMAGYRNRMVHFYSEITEKELYKIIQENLKDFEKFCRYINKLITNPKKYGLDIKQ